MMSKEADGWIYITKGTPVPYSCPKCEALVPCTPENVGEPIQKCLMCEYEGPLEEFDIEWEFKPLVKQ